MKVTPVNGLGSFGVYVDGIDMDHMTDDQWKYLGSLSVEHLLLIFRDIKITKGQYADWIPKWGPLKADLRARFRQKYGDDFDALKPETWPDNLDQGDLLWLTTRKFGLEPVNDGTGRHLTRIYGGKDAAGNMLGAFAYGPLSWHSNEASSVTFSPYVSLLGWEEMQESTTGFLQTVDWYEKQTESFRNELDDMVIEHGYKQGSLNENEHTNPDFSLFIKMSMVPDEGMETPLVCTAPNGRKGLRYTINTSVKIKGLSEQESSKFFERLDRELFTEEYIFDHEYKANQKDLLIFDNSVMLHRRTGGLPKRKAFRMQYDVSPLIDEAWRPFQHLPEYDRQYIEKTHYLVNTVGGDLKARFKLAPLD